ncbi:hypothetical protein [Kitasatospora cinereorecta]|uniref:Integral membrane protein n=1 Tax=Kitasatospora cinereorecta TaxID=285560 RepID=A0ABW0VEB3_9ACTN
MSVTAALQPSRAAATDVRLVRAAAFATASVTLASAAHAAAGGPLGPGRILCGWLLAWAAAAAGTGRERTLPAVVTAMLMSQLGLHLFFVAGHALLAPPAVRPVTPAMDGMAGMDGMPGMQGAAGHVHGAHLPSPGGAHAAAHTTLLGLSPGMLAGHAAAALATGWLLHRVDTALWRLLGLARTVRATARHWRARIADTLDRLTGRSSALLARPARTRRPPRARTHRIRPLLLDHTLVRRGPPGGVYA